MMKAAKIAVLYVAMAAWKITQSNGFTIIPPQDIDSSIQMDSLTNKRKLIKSNLNHTNDMIQHNLSAIKCTQINGDSETRHRSFTTTTNSKGSPPFSNLIPLAFTSFMILFSICTNPSLALDETKGMNCVAKNCSQELSKCLSDANCTRGLGCFISCSSMDALKSGPNKLEGSCQVRCMDLYQNSILDDFTECTLTNNRCYEPIKADNRYPSLPIDLSDERLLGNVDSTMKELQSIFQGSWYIIGGLNKAFDTFNCQIHEFSEPILDNETRNREKNEKAIADAKFSYRVKTNGGFFTKVGEKSLVLTSDPRKKKLEPRYEQGSGKWGLDTFVIDPKKTVPDKNTQEHRFKLQLKLRPSIMRYADDWTILSYSTEPEVAFIVVAYRGTNSAWEGYGGVNIYTREPIHISSLKDSGQFKHDVKTIAMRKGIDQGLEKIGLNLDDLYPVDNTCL